MTKRLQAASAVLLAAAGLAFAPQAPAQDIGEQDNSARFSRSVEGRSTADTDLRAALASAPSKEFAALLTEGPRTSPAAAQSSKVIGSSASTRLRVQAHDTVDFWIYDASSEVFYDFDHDGYFHGFAITFDADVSEGVADVYAELYLSRNGGPWNRYYTTRVFSIFGSTSEDVYEVVTDLDVGYPPGDYDVLIELYDADSGDFLADLDPFDDPDLAFLPLEDAEYDAPPIHGGGYYGGGSSGPIMILLLVLLLAWRQQRRDRRALQVTAPAPHDPA